MENRACAVLGNLEIIVTVNDLRFMEKRKNTNFPKLTKGALVVLYQKNLVKRLNNKLHDGENF